MDDEPGWNAARLDECGHVVSHRVDMRRVEPLLADEPTSELDQSTANG